MHRLNIARKRVYGLFYDTLRDENQIQIETQISRITEDAMQRIAKGLLR